MRRRLLIKRTRKYREFQTTDINGQAMTMRVYEDGRQEGWQNDERVIVPIYRMTKELSEYLEREGFYNKPDSKFSNLKYCVRLD